MDTQVLTWIKRTPKVMADERQRQKIEQAGYLLEELEASKAQIMLPSVVVAEYLSAIAPGDRGNVLAELSEQFWIVPFDQKDTITAARLFDFGQTTRKKGQVNSRRVLRADSLIVATIKNHGAREFYCEDAGCCGLAREVGLTAKPLPTIAPSLFSGGT